MHGPRCFLQEPPGHVHLCMGAYGEHSSRLRNFEGFKLVTYLKETKEAKCNLLESLKMRHYSSIEYSVCGHKDFIIFLMPMTLIKLITPFCSCNVKKNILVKEGLMELCI